MAQEHNFTLYEGEKLKCLRDHHAVYKYIPGHDPAKPLVAFVPGMAHNARIAYGGHAGHRSEDFLAHWFNHHGYGFLGISYPLETDPPMMPVSSSNFTIPEWGQQAADAIDAVITEHNLSRSVVVLVWSMGGKILQPVTVAAKRLGIAIELFISLAATPALPGLLTAVSKTQLDKTTAGYATKPFLEKAFLRQMDEQDKINHEIDEKDMVTQKNAAPRHIIDPTIFKRDYIGATPIGITASGFRYDAATKEFVKEDNEWQFMDDGQAHDYANLPAMAAIYPTSALDFRHAITDKATWSFLMIQRAMAKMTQDGTATAYQQIGDDGAAALSQARFRFQEMQRVVMNIPELMTAEILGNHFFFVGESGARQTVETVVGFLENLVTVQQDIAYELSSL
jgi:hypothetical protein